MNSPNRIRHLVVPFKNWDICTVTAVLLQALNAYGTACHLNPALKASWLGQYQLLETLSMKNDSIRSNKNYRGSVTCRPN